MPNRWYTSCLTREIVVGARSFGQLTTIKVNNDTGGYLNTIKNIILHNQLFPGLLCGRALFALSLCECESNQFTLWAYQDFFGAGAPSPSAYIAQKTYHWQFNYCATGKLLLSCRGNQEEISTFQQCNNTTFGALTTR